MLPSNATRIHGSGTDKDPKCTLRTRVKRSAIARFERNFFSWRIPGEGPPRPNMDDNNDRRRKQNRKKSSGDSVFSKRNMSSSVKGDDKSYFSASEDYIDDMTEMSINSFNEDAAEQDTNDNHQSARRARFVQKIFRNMEVSIRDLHVRCEVGEGALDSDPQKYNQHLHKRMDSQEQGRDHNVDDKSAFSFGINFDALVLKSANSSWNTGEYF